MNGASMVSGSPMPTDNDGCDVISDNDFVSVVSSHVTIVNVNDKELMPVRLSPDGADEGDDLQITNEQTEYEDDAWSDWETEKQPENDEQMATAQEKLNDDQNAGAFESKNETSITTPSYQRNISVSSTNSTATNNNYQNNNDSLIKDIKDIEIKPVNNQLDNEIDDFFKDMEPVIEIPNSITSLLNSCHFENDSSSNKDLPRKNLQNENKIDQNRFAVTVSMDDDTAWEDEANDWDN